MGAVSATGPSWSDTEREVVAVDGGDVMRVGVIGRGFGARVVAPAFEATGGCRVADVVSPRDEAAVAALCRRDDVDLISIHSPPFLHLDNVRRAVAGGHAVLCDKPFGRNADEAKEMCALADDAGTVGLVNFEQRFDPARQQLRALARDGVIGEPEHFHCSMITSITRAPLRRFGWLFRAELGGGWLGALGSHLIDFARWTFGDIAEASGQLRTAVTERPDADGNLHRCTAEDGFVATLRSASGVTMTIDSTSASPVNFAPTTLLIGSEGVLEVTGDARIVLRDGAGQRELFTPQEPGGDALLLAMRSWAGLVRDIVRGATVEAGVPTFADGLACAEVMDSLRAS